MSAATVRTSSMGPLLTSRMERTRSLAAIRAPIRASMPCSTRLPRPGNWKLRSPMVNISQAMRANHPPATETMEFQTRPIAE